jgi:serine phosphatase RsbU (regulator of sigma subunit)
MRWWRARLLQDWAEVYAARGIPADSERAQALLRDAFSLFDKMGADYYTELVTDKLQALEAQSYTQALAHQKIAQEMAQAGKLQEDFLPREPPRIPGWQLVATLKPARETSGDFYDFIPLSDGRWGIVIADVADKGAGAALYMTLSRTLIRTFAREYPNQPQAVFNAVNQRIFEDTPANLFVTAFYGILDPATGSLVYCNAGHNPPYHLDSENGYRAQPLTKTGLPLGIFEDRLWEGVSVQMAEGDVLVMYTDGIVDAQNPQEAFFGNDRLLSCFQTSLEHSAQHLKDAIIAKIDQFSSGAPQVDDITLVILARTQETSEYQ